MGCNNTNVKEDENKNSNLNKYILVTKNEKKEESRIDSDEGNKNNNKKIIKSLLINDDPKVKGVLNILNGTISKPQFHIVPKLTIFKRQIPEDKKPPNLEKLLQKKRLKDSNNMLENNTNVTNILNQLNINNKNLYSP